MMHAYERSTTVEDGQGQTDRSRDILNTYLEALLARGDYGKHFAETVTFTLMDTGEVTQGREAVVGLIDYLHTQAFDATPVVRSLVVDGKQAVLEADFAGEHAGEFAGIGPTGRQVKLPYAVVYDVDTSSITALRIYLSMDALVRQITEEP